MARSYASVPRGDSAAQLLQQPEQQECELGQAGEAAAAGHAAAAAGPAAPRSASRLLGAFVAVGLLMVVAAAVAGVPRLQEQRAAAQLSAGEAGDRGGIGQNFVSLEAFMCDEGINHWERGWSDAKKDWCCTFKRQGCRNRTQTEELVASFDCQAGLGRWEAGWSIRKKSWCCKHQKLGCPEPDHVSVTFVVANLDFAKLRASQFVLTCFEVSLLEEVVKQAAHGIAEKDVVMDYWAGSGMPDWSGDRRGVVVRARLTVPSSEDVQAVRDAMRDVQTRLVLAQAVRDCSGIEAVSTPTITVHRMQVEGAIVRPCTCANGFAKHGDECPQKGGELCGDCAKGYHLTSGGFCVKNACTCAGGIQAEGSLCVEHEKEKCSSCFVGYHLFDDTGVCKRNICACAAGYGATGSACKLDGAELCGSCYPGYHVDAETSMCEPTVCTCAYGSPALAKMCPEEGAHVCSSCQAGYHLLTTGKCAPNVCHCSMGTAAVGLLCSKHDANLCAWCQPGLHLMDNGTCGEKTCHCPQGIAATGEKCTTNNAVVCQQCNPGYRHEMGQCVGLPCGCEHGTALSGESCTEPGKSICGTCDSGYRLVGMECKRNECVCEQGEPAVGAQCLAPGQQSCGTCHLGYRHSLERSRHDGTSHLSVNCVPNECHCRDGDRDVGERATALTNPQCTINGGNICVSCLGNYHMSPDNQCVAKQCTCDNGTPVDSDSCQIHGARNCTSCSTGFFLANRPAEHTRFGASGKHRASDFNEGVRLCLADHMTTAKPFNCQVALDNWESAWSRVKKHWCCANEQLGCQPMLTGVDHCENQGYSREQCSFVGCCSFDEASKKCMSAVGEKVCYPEFNIRSSQGFCLRSSARDILAGEMPVDVVGCSPDDINEEWSPTPTGQIESPLGFCLEAAAPESGAVSIVARECSRSSPPSVRQILIYMQETAQFKTQDKLCLAVVLPNEEASTTEKKVQLKECSSVDTMQQWRVFQAETSTS